MAMFLEHYIDNYDNIVHLHVQKLIRLCERNSIIKLLSERDTK